MRPRSVLVLCLLAALGQYAAAQQTPGVGKPASPPPASPPPAAPAQKAAEEKPPAEPPNSWSDPRVIAELVKNCRFKPLSDRPEWFGQIGAGSTHPLACLSGRDQSCTPDPCFTDMKDDGCRALCEDTCTDCATSCGDKCASCRAHCKNDACRTGCAKQCATCQQGCVRAVDRCSTGKCAAEYSQCHARLKADWARYHCDNVCAEAKNVCVKKCQRGQPKGTELDAPCVEECIDDRTTPHCILSQCRSVSYLAK